MSINHYNQRTSTQTSDAFKRHWTEQLRTPRHATFHFDTEPTFWQRLRAWLHRLIWS